MTSSTWLLRQGLKQPLKRPILSLLWIKVLLYLCVQSLSLCRFKCVKEVRSCCPCVNPCKELGGQRPEHTLGASAGCFLAQKLMPRKC